MKTARSHPQDALTSVIRHLVILTSFLLVASPAFSQTTVPLLVNYQGTVTDGTGMPLGATGTVSAPVAAPVNRKVLFRFWDATTGGTRLWTEEQTVTISLGQFSVLLGQGINATGTASGESRPALDTVFGGSGNDRFLGVTVDNGDNAITAADVEISPRQRITSVAYSLRARTADSVATTSDLMLGGSANNGLGFYSSTRLFNGATINGPVLYGVNGGVLGAVNGATQTPVLRWNELGQVGIGTTSLPSGSRLTLQGDDTNAPPLQINIRGSADTNKRLLIGYNTTGNYGSIQPYSAASTATSLFLNPIGGNVGIGMATTPTARLDVTGGIKASGAGGFTFNTGDADGGLFSPADGVLTLFTNNSERLRVDGSGNVGIGTATPGARLQIDSLGNALPATSGSTQSVGLIARLKSAGSADAGLDIGSADTGGFWLQSANRATLNVNYSLLLNPNGGNVGIGTNSPTRKLLVESDGHGISHKNGTKELTTYMDSNTGNPCLVGTVSNNSLGFFTNNSSARMLIDSNGNVGVGAASPAAKLHIKAASDNSVGAGIKLEHAGDTSGWFIWPENTNDNLLFMFNNQYPSGVYSLLSKNSSGFITVSDERIKKDIEVISGSLERVMKLRPKTYRFKSAEADTPLNYGFIAQEVEKVYPDLVGESRGQKTLAINSLISINTQAIQELKQEKDAEVKLLRQENEAMKAALAEQTKQLAEFKAKDKARDAKLAAIEKLLLTGEKAEVQPVSLKKSAGGAE